MRGDVHGEKSNYVWGFKRPPGAFALFALFDQVRLSETKVCAFRTM